jgi:hypothetical protein
MNINNHADAAKYAEIAIESEYKSHANLAACYLDSQAKLRKLETAIKTGVSHMGLLDILNE